MQTGFKKVLNLRKHLINIGCQLDFQSGTLLYGFLPETSQSLQIHHIEIKETDESEVVLHHKSFYEKNQTTVTLEEGAVKVYCEEKKGTEQKSLSPGEQAVIQSKTINTQTVQVQEYTSWANGIYEYTDTSLETIVQQLSRWYNVNMTFADPQLRERKFAGVIFRDQPLQKAVDILSKVSNVHFRQKGNVIEITENRPQY